MIEVNQDNVIAVFCQIGVKDNGPDYTRVRMREALRTLCPATGHSRNAKRRRSLAHSQRIRPDPLDLNRHESRLTREFETNAYGVLNVFRSKLQIALGFI